VDAPAWVIEALFTHPGGEGSRAGPPVDRLATRSLGRLEEQWSLGAQGGLHTFGKPREPLLSADRPPWGRALNTGSAQLLAYPLKELF
jgi:hypothetical protein